MRKLIRTIVLIVSIAVFCFSAYKLYDYYSEMKQGEDAVDELKNVAVTEVREGEKAPISVDFAALKAENPDIVAWLYSADTPINYPVVQSDDNNYYLRRLTDGSYNSNGTLFVDFRDAPDFSGFNTIIYGHRMKSKAMFGTLPGYLEQEYYEEHPVMYLLTPALLMFCSAMLTAFGEMSLPEILKLKSRSLLSSLYISSNNSSS